MIPVQFWDLSQLSDLELTEELARTQEGKTVTLGHVYIGLVPCYSPELLDTGPESTLIVINLEPPQAPVSVGASGVQEEDMSGILTKVWLPVGLLTYLRITS